MDITKILFLSHYGANHQFQDFFSEIGNRPGFEVKVVLPKEVQYTNGYQPQYFLERKTINNVEYIPGKLFRKKTYLLSGYFPALPLAIMQHNPDIIIVTDETFTFDTFFVVLYKLLFFKRYRIVTWSQAKYFEDSSYLPWPVRILLKFNKLFAHRFVARNHGQEERIKKALPIGNKVKTVYWSSDPAQFKPLNLSSAKLVKKLKQEIIFDQKYILGFVGRVVPEKGVLNIIQALADLPEHVSFVVAGDGNEEYIMKCKKYITEHKLEKRCFMLGAQDYDRLVYLYNIIDLLILPTNKGKRDFYELFGRVLVEAMMTKTLILGSNNGAIPEVVGDDRFIFQQGNQQSMIEKILFCLNLDDTERTKILESNYLRSQQKFTIKAFADNLLELSE
ncbi:MAG: glycosyltransferase family 4 protein [bacterium]|nr:glycosyltransferase family 4 protein [bacterium]